MNMLTLTAEKVLSSTGLTSTKYLNSIHDKRRVKQGRTIDSINWKGRKYILQN
jgi:hypothetical protein